MIEERLAAFFAAILLDQRIGVSHVSLYVAILLAWGEGGGVDPVMVRRVALMERAKIRGRGTYNKCMKELDAYGYIRYEPSKDGRKGSGVWVGGDEIILNHNKNLLFN